MSTTAAASSNNIASALIAEMEQEAKVTRTCLERVPADKFDWKPHEKSMPFGKLGVDTWSADLAQIPARLTIAVQPDVGGQQVRHFGLNGERVVRVLNDPGADRGMGAGKHEQLIESTHRTRNLQ